MDASKLPLFLETPAFVRRWSILGLTDRDLAALQWAIIADPNMGTVMEGTGGFRKVRFAPPSLSVGKSGAVRILYLSIPKFRTVVLGSLFAKNEVTNINAAGKAALKKIEAKYTAALEKHFKRRH